MKRKDKDAPSIMLVEGKDDEHVCYSLLEYHAVPEVFTVIDGEGIDQIFERLEIDVDVRDRRHIGIILDADIDVMRRWAALHNILMNRGYHDLPTKPDPDGTIIRQEGRPTIGIWIMPDNQIPGMLEDFVGFLVPDGDSLWKRAERCLKEIIGEERRFAEAHLSKAHIHTWLAWQADPGTPLGLAITKKYFNAEAPHAHKLMAWMRRLYELSPGS